MTHTWHDPYGHPRPGWPPPEPPRRKTGLIVGLLAAVLAVAAFVVTGFVAPGLLLDDEPVFEAGTPPVISSVPPPPALPVPSEPAVPHSGAPAVEFPVADTARWEANPCGLISRQDMAAADYRPEEKEADVDGNPECVWDGSVRLRVMIAKKIPDGLSGLYLQRPMFTLFEEQEPIRRMPAVIADLVDNRDKGSCSVLVGLTDDLAFETRADANDDAPQADDPCAFTLAMAEAALRRMQDGG